MRLAVALQAFNGAEDQLVVGPVEVTCSDEFRDLQPRRRIAEQRAEYTFLRFNRVGSGLRRAHAARSSVRSDKPQDPHSQRSAEATRRPHMAQHVARQLPVGRRRPRVTSSLSTWRGVRFWIKALIAANASHFAVRLFAAERSLIA